MPRASLIRWPMLHPVPGPDSFAAWARRYLEASQIENLSPYTVQARYQDLAWFCRWCSERDLSTPREITKPILERYQRHLFYYRKQDGKPLSVQRQTLLIVHVKGFFRWLTRHNHILTNPASELELPRKPRLQLREPLSLAEVEQVLALPDLSDPLGLRDRAMLEVLYSTGVRRLELVSLSLHDVDPNRGTVFVRQGKGKKDRVVPIGERALAWVQKYLDEVRPALVADPREPHLFLSVEGRPFCRENLTAKVRDYFTRAKVRKSGSCHLFRHTAATLMLENGADLRYIQQMLGHSELSTTERYTHVSITKLKEIHAATHPGAKLARKARTGADAAALISLAADDAGQDEARADSAAPAAAVLRTSGPL